MSNQLTLKNRSMQIINGWVFCNRYTNSGKLTSSVISLDAITEIVENHDGHALIIMDHDDGIIETDTNMVDALDELTKYLTNNQHQ